MSADAPPSFLETLALDSLTRVWMSLAASSADAGVEDIVASYLRRWKSLRSFRSSEGAFHGQESRNKGTFLPVRLRASDADEAGPPTVATRPDRPS